jgi:hypothetical protein
MRSLLLFFKTLTIGKSILLALAPIIAMILTIETFLLALFLLLIIDLITGISKTLHQKKIKANPFNKNFWTAIKSKGFRDTCKKTYQYLLFVIAFLIIDVLVLKGRLITIPLLGGEATLSEIAISALCFIELWSIGENIEAAGGINLLKKATVLLPKMQVALTNQEKKVEK